ncbi:MAG: thiamine-phosphate kinase, partial [Clostridia bacterium]|nr:thiamine-phosphate kinase [Clostridia bacterium]
VPSKNGLAVSVSAVGEIALLTEKRMPKPKTKDLICVSGSLGAAYMGLQLLERGKKDFAQAEKDIAQYKMLVAAYLKPEMDWNVVKAMEGEELYPSAGYLVTHGLRRRLTAAGFSR